MSRRRRPHLVCRAFYPSGVRPAPNSDSALIFVTDRRSRTCTVVDSTKCTPFLFLVRLYRAHGDVPRTTIDKLAVPSARLETVECVCMTRLRKKARKRSRHLLPAGLSFLAQAGRLHHLDQAHHPFGLVEGQPGLLPFVSLQCSEGALDY